jgi:hypothetical protein
MSDSTLGSAKQLIDLRDNSSGVPNDLGARWRTGANTYMAISASVSIPAYGVVKFVGSTGYTVTPTAVTTDLVVGVLGSTALAAAATGVIQTQGVCTVLLLTGVQAQAIDVPLVPAGSGGVGMLNIISLASGNLMQTKCGHLISAALSTGAGTSGLAYIHGLGA